MIAMSAAVADEAIVIEGADSVTVTKVSRSKRFGQWLRRQGEKIRAGARNVWSWLTRTGHSMWNGAKRFGNSVGRNAKTAGRWSWSHLKTAGRWSWSRVRDAGSWLYWSGGAVGRGIGRVGRFLGRSSLTLVRGTPKFLGRTLSLLVLRPLSWVFLTALEGSILLFFGFIVLAAIVLAFFAASADTYDRKVHRRTKAWSKGRRLSDEEKTAGTSWIESLSDRLDSWSGPKEAKAPEGDVHTITEVPAKEEVPTTTVEMEPGTTARVQMDSTVVEATKEPETPEAPVHVPDYSRSLTLGSIDPTVSPDPIQEGIWPLPDFNSGRRLSSGTDTGMGDWAIEPGGPILEVLPEMTTLAITEHWYFHDYISWGITCRGALMDPPLNMGLAALELETAHEAEVYTYDVDAVKLQKIDVDHPLETPGLTDIIIPGRPGLVTQTEEERFRNLSYWTGRSLALKNYREILAVDRDNASRKTGEQWAFVDKGFAADFQSRELHRASLKIGYDFMVLYFKARESALGVPETWPNPFPPQGAETPVSV